MKKSNIYTRTGDNGLTGLVSGNRILKSDLRIDLYGEVDELNSRIGFACSVMSKFPDLIKFNHKIQSALFDLGSNLACEQENREKYKLPQLSESLIKDIENEIDRMDSELHPLKNFILPGGSLASSSLHLVRTGARNVERKLVAYEQLTDEKLPVLSVAFINRLSDYFFVLARYVGKEEGVSEVAWKPHS